MDPFNPNLKQYSQLQELSLSEFQIISKQRKVVLLGNLIIDIQGFNHPGYNSILDAYVNREIYGPYMAKNHSINADLILCQRTIGKFNDEKLQHHSKQFYNSVINNQKIKKHNQIIKKLQPNQPLLQVIKTLNAQQLFLLTQIPKAFKEPEQVKFLKDKYENFMYEEHFWISTPIFLSYLLALIIWVLYSYQMKQILAYSIFTLIGVVTWTKLQYIYHRFLFHPSLQQLKKKLEIRGHSLHHAFPNLKNKLSLGIRGNTFTMAVIYLVITTIISQLVASMFFLGLLSSMIAYDAIHYYCHFGTETQFSWLKTLRINHLKHHYRNQTTNFGVTTNFWDKVWGTYDQKLKDK